MPILETPLVSCLHYKIETSHFYSNVKSVKPNTPNGNETYAIVVVQTLKMDLY
jgi:hypothetical protein